MRRLLPFRGRAWTAPADHDRPFDPEAWAAIAPAPAGAATLPELVVTAPSWWTQAGCRRRTPVTRNRCIRLRGHAPGCLPVPDREYRPARLTTYLDPEVDRG